jgi:hypothetical protein
MEWKPGWVWAIAGEVEVQPGQRWDYFKKDPEGDVPMLWQGCKAFALPVSVVGRLPSGEVVLRPRDPAILDRLYPTHTATHDRRGQPLKEPSVERPGCPFFWVDAKRAKSEADKIRKLNDLLKAAKDPVKIKILETQLAETFPYEAEDLLAHEAWDVWKMMERDPQAKLAGPTSAGA